MTLSELPLSGSLPSSWGGDGAFPELIELRLGGFAPGTCHLTGPLPESWGSPAAFQNLLNLVIRSCNLQGDYCAIIACGSLSC